MSVLKRLFIAGMICLFMISIAQAFHYPIYKPVVSTAYETPVLNTSVKNSQSSFISIIDFAKTPALLLLQSQQSKLFQITLHNPHYLPVHNIKLLAPKGMSITKHSNNCTKHALLPMQHCAFNWVYQPSSAQQQITRKVLPLTLQYEYNGHNINEHIKLLVVQVPKNTFYKAPVQQYPTAKGIGSDYVKSLFVDQAGDLYVGSDGGLSEGLDHNHYFKNITSLNGLGDNDITAVIKDPSGTLYVGTDGAGLAISEDNGLTFHMKTVNNGLAGNHVRSLYWDHHKLYVGTNHGLSISDDQGNHFSNRGLDNGLQSLMINQIIANNGQIFVATDNGLAVSNNEGDSFSNLTTQNGLGDNAVNAIAIDEHKQIYAATENGLSVSQDDGETFQTFTKKNGLLSNRILSVAISPANRKVYVGTDSGLNFKNIDSRNFKANHAANASAHDAVNAIVISPLRPVIYLALGGDGLSVANVTGDETMHIQSNLIADNILSGLWVHDNEVHIATASGLSQSLDGGMQYHTWRPNQTDANINAFFSSENGNEYMGTNEGLYVIRHSQKTTQLLPNYQINSVAQDVRDNRLFVATERGVMVQQGGSGDFVQHTIDDGLGADDVHQVVYDPIKQMVYAATANGLSYSADGGEHFTNVMIPNSDSNITQMIISPLGCIYVGTDQGLYKAYWDQQQLHWHKISLGQGVDKAITSLDYNNQQCLLLVGTIGGVYLSFDGGESFKTMTQGLADKTVVGANSLPDEHSLLVATRQHGLWASYYQ